ncbi:IclR family transcriptional regulator [Pseudoclavibacter sp. RFBG4]|uniref:IclR family transcriptional regulator n=1 Tax=Pseudoclavibacter sp. RFBG4 TaxID=2080575 RepID=UPI0011AFF64F|nr:IclR family transcriptional regulator [Pseudoclavibacter sp. RFBG4]
MSETSSQYGDDSGSTTVRSVDRAMVLIQALANAQGKGCKLAEIVGATDLSKATAHRILATLMAAGWVEFDSQSGVYHLGVALVGIGAAASARHGVLELARPHLERLEQLAGDTVYLSVLIGGWAVCADLVQGSHPVRVVDTLVGDKRPLGSCAGSLALLSWMEDEALSASLAAQLHQRAFGPKVPEASELQRLMEASRTQGFTEFFSADMPEVVGLGVPVFGAGGEPVAALSVLGTVTRLAEPRRERVVEWLKNEGEALTKDLQSLNPGFGLGDVRRAFAV